MYYCNICNQELYGHREKLRGSCSECAKSKCSSPNKIKTVKYYKKKLKKRYNWYEFPNISDNLKNIILDFCKNYEEFDGYWFKCQNHTYHFGFVKNEIQVRLSCKNNRRRIFTRIIFRCRNTFGCLDIQTGKFVMSANYHWAPRDDWYFSSAFPLDDSCLDDSWEPEFDFSESQTFQVEKDEKFKFLRTSCDDYINSHFKIPVVR